MTARYDTDSSGVRKTHLRDGRNISGVEEGLRALPKIASGRGWNLGPNAGKRLWCV